MARPRPRSSPAQARITARAVPVPEAVLPPADPDHLPTQEYHAVVLETHARRTLLEVMTERFPGAPAQGKDSYAYEPGDRIRAAIGALPSKTELTGAHGGPVPIQWVSPINPKALRKAPQGSR